jgi:hypothetical protein
MSPLQDWLKQRLFRPSWSRSVLLSLALEGLPFSQFLSIGAICINRFLRMRPSLGGHRAAVACRRRTTFRCRRPNMRYSSSPNPRPFHFPPRIALNIIHVYTYRIFRTRRPSGRRRFEVACRREPLLPQEPRGLYFS